MALTYTTLRDGLYKALEAPLLAGGSPPPSPAQQKNLKLKANGQADAIMGFLTKGIKHWSITEFTGAVELDSMKNNPIDADIKMGYTFSMIAIYFMLIKILFEPLKKLVVTKPLYGMIVGIISKLEQALAALIPTNPGVGQVGVPIELGKAETSLVAHGHCFVGPLAAPIGEDGATLANPLGEHTKVVLHDINIIPKEKAKLV